MCSKPNHTYINEHNRLVVASISHQYFLGMQLDPDDHLDNIESRANSLSLVTIRTLLNMSVLEKAHILSVYTLIYEYWTKLHERPVQPYAPGSILSLHGQTLVGRVWENLGAWQAYWKCGFHHGINRFVIMMISIYYCSG